MRTDVQEIILARHRALSECASCRRKLRVETTTTTNYDDGNDDTIPVISIIYAPYTHSEVHSDTPNLGKGPIL